MPNFIPESNSSDIASILIATGITRDMTDNEVALLAGMAEECRYEKGTSIIIEDDKSRDLYIVHKGRVSVRLTMPTEFGKDEIVYNMREGQVFGELSLVDGSPRSATIKAEDPVLAYRFDFKKLSAAMDENPRVGYLLMRNIAAIISTRIRNTNMLWRNSIIW